MGFNNLLEVLIGRSWVDAEIRSRSIDTVTEFFNVLLDKYDIEISKMDVEELAASLIDELCMQEHNKEINA